MAQHASTRRLYFHVVFDCRWVPRQRGPFYATDVEALWKPHGDCQLDLRRDPDLKISLVADRHIRNPVFIAIAQGVKYPQGFIIGRRSLKWLQLLDESTCFIENAVQPPLTSLEVVRRCLEDRKLVLATFGSWCILEHQPTDHMIQRRTQVVQEVTDQNAQLDRWDRIFRLED